MKAKLQLIKTTKQYMAKIFFKMIDERLINHINERDGRSERDADLLAFICINITIHIFVLIMVIR